MSSYTTPFLYAAGRAAFRASISLICNILKSWPGRYYAPSFFYSFGPIIINEDKLKAVLLTGLGGFIGSAARYLCQWAGQRLVPGHFPLATLLVNLAGCLLIGLVYGSLGKSSWMTADWRLFLATGICGGFTTFSSFSYENVRLVQQGMYMQVLLYLCLSVVGGFALTLLGMFWASGRLHFS